MFEHGCVTLGADGAVGNKAGRRIRLAGGLKQCEIPVELRRQFIQTEPSISLNRSRARRARASQRAQASLKLPHVVRAKRDPGCLCVTAVVKKQLLHRIECLHEIETSDTSTGAAHHA